MPKDKWAWWHNHTEEWSACQRCPLHRTARTHVLADLQEGIPPDILFIGEGPGKSENMLGRPFVGRAGKLLRLGVDRGRSPGMRIAYANLVACRPCDGVSEPNRVPSHEEVMACAPRLTGLIKELSPRRIVYLGRVPAQYRYLFPEIDFRELAHPAWIVRRGGALAPEWPEYVQRLRSALAL